MISKRGLVMFSVFAVIAVLVVSVLMVNFVFAQDDADLAPFDATVTVSNAPPTIVRVFSVEDDNAGDPCSGDAAASGDVQPCEEGVSVTNLAEFTFIVEDPNGPADLPGIVVPADSAVALVAADVAITLDDPTANALGAITRTGNGLTCTATQCADGTNANCNAASVIAGFGTDHTLQKQYVCTITMNFFDPPALSNTAAADMWHVEVVFRDSGLDTDTYRSDDVAFDELRYMEYLTVSAVGTTGGISWTGLDINVVDTPQDVPPFTMDNAGNTAIGTVNLKAQDLTGDVNPSAIMLSSAFSTDTGVGGADSGACDGPSGGGGLPNDATELVTNTDVQLAGVGVPYSADGTDTADINFCIWAAVNPTYLAGPFDASYAANDACGPTCDTAGEQWEVTFFSVA